MKKILILLTIFLISCGSENETYDSENETYDLDHPAEEVNGVSLVDCLVSKGWENIPTIELRGDRVHLIFDEPFDGERYDVLQEECLDIVWQSVEVVEETEEAPSNIEADTTTTTTVADTTTTTVVLDKSAFEILDKHPKVECLNTVGATMFIDVFGMYVIAAKESPLEKVLHTANVLAQYLDNDEDGFADDPNVLWQLVENNYIMPVWPIDGGADGLTVSEIRQKCSNVNIGAYMFIEDINGNGGDSYVFGGIANDNSFTNGGDGEWDANLEEIFHTVTWGWYRAYPEYFANGDWWPWTGIENKDLIGGKGELSSKLTTAMDAARGGWFEDTPDQYPDNAWYTYVDKSCGYGCQSIEYLYWLLMSNIGALDPSITNKCEKSKSEWFICTKEELKERDVLGFELINNYGFNLPTNIPDGNYKGTP